jgi:putative peptidoglycan lipid II flippase
MNANKSANAKLIKGTGLVSLLTIISRILGFVRDHVMARFLGAGILTDVFFVAYRIPNLLRNLLAEGALNSAFLPAFAQEHSKSDLHAQEFLKSMFSILLILGTSVSLLGILFSEEIISLIGAGFNTNPEAQKLCIQLTKVMFPYILFVSFIALLNSALLSYRVYGASALAQIFMNIVFIIAAFFSQWFTQENALFVLAYGVLVGGIVQIVIQLPMLHKAGLRIAFSKKIVTKSTKVVFLLFIPAFIGAAVNQLITFMNTMLASSLPSGSISWLHYADRISQLPTGIFAVALSSVLFPSFSIDIANKNFDNFTRSFGNGLRYLSFVMIPASFGIFFMAEPLIKFFFESGRFLPNDTHQAALALKAMAIGLWTSSCLSLTVRAFHSFKDMLTPCFISLATLFFGFYASLALMGPIQQAEHSKVLVALKNQQNLIYAIFPSSPNLGHIGLASSWSIMSSLSFVVLLYFLNKKHSINLKIFLSSSIKASLASIAMVIAIESVNIFDSFLLINLLIKVFVAGIIYLLAGLALKSSEAWETLRLAQKALKRFN